VLAGVSGVATTARAEDFFSALFGGGRPAAPPQQMIQRFFGEAPRPAPRTRVSSSGGQAWCVRSCDGRYFPVSGPDNASRAASCHSFCPASETSLVYGSNIDDATTESGKSYADLPNAFRYRKELVAGCTCNGKSPAGLAQIPADGDPTLRKGDIVATANGLMTADRDAAKRSSMNFSPMSEQARARIERLPVVARE
jgi:hypothetical protein